LAIRSGILSGFVSNSIGFLAQFVTSIVVARYLGPEQLGAFVVCMSLMIVLQALREFGVSQFVVKEADLTEQKTRTVLTVCIIIGWALGLALLLARYPLSAFFKQPEIMNIIPWIAAGFLPLPFSQLALALMRRERRYSEVALCGLIGALSGSLVTVLGIYYGNGVTSLAHGVFATAIMTTLAACFFRPVLQYIKPTFTGWREVFTFGSRVTLNSLLPSVGLGVPDMALAKLATVEEAAIYNRGFHLVRMFEKLVFPALYSVLGAEFGVANRSKKSPAPLVKRATASILATLWPALALVAWRANDIVSLLYGERWLLVAPVLSVLCLWRGISLLVACAVPVYEGYGAVNLQLRNETVLQSASIALSVVGASFGMLALAILRIPLACLSVVMHMTVLKTHGEVQFSEITKTAVAPFGVVIAMSAVLYITQLFGGSLFGETHLIIRLAIETFICTILTATIYWFFAPGVLNDLLSFVRRRKTKTSSD
jgi:O-antigen/teichoic acid export membrane protein